MMEDMVLVAQVVEMMEVVVENLNGVRPNGYR
jgi:hypothetical protein